MQNQTRPQSMRFSFARPGPRVQGDPEPAVKTMSSEFVPQPTPPTESADAARSDAAMEAARDEDSPAMNTGLRFAHMACLALGCAMILWALASVVVARAATGEGLTLSQITANSIVLLTGAMFGGFHLLIRRRVRWALVAALVSAGALFVIALGVSLVLQTHMGNSYLIVLSFVTTVSCWLALETLNVPDAPPQPVEAQPRRRYP